MGRERRIRKNKIENRNGRQREGGNENFENSKHKIRFDAVTNDPVSQWLQTSVCFSLMVCIH